MDVNIAAFGGSLREHSFNKHLLRAAARIGRDLCDIEVFDVGELPHYNQDLDPRMGGASELPDAVAAFVAGVERAHGILLVSPEYNWGVPGFLKNAVDWLSRPASDSVLVGRPLLLMGASTGPAGTGRAQLVWRQIFTAIRVPVLLDTLQVPFGPRRIEPDGTIDTALDAEITRLMALLVAEADLARTLDLPQKLRRPAPPRTAVAATREGDLGTARI
jgi:chromate reductase